jgi:acyl carrier protein
MEIQNFQDTNLSTIAPESIKADICKDPTSAVEIQAWIVSYLAELLEIEPDEVNPTIPFDRYGLDSSAAVGLTGDLEDWMEKKLDPTLLYDYPTVEALSRHLAEEFK